MSMFKKIITSCALVVLATFSLNAEGTISTNKETETVITAVASTTIDKASESDAPSTKENTDSPKKTEAASSLDEQGPNNEISTSDDKDSSNNEILTVDDKDSNESLLAACPCGCSKQNCKCGKDKKKEKNV